MDEGKVQARAAALLREYLATRDVPCEGCGYNLRGAQDVFCPECGAVIPRPPAELLDCARTPLSDLKLWCFDCGLTLTGVDTALCPECGGRTLQRYRNRTPPRRPRVPGVPRCLPLLLAANAAIGVTMTMMVVSVGWQSWLRSGKTAASAAASLLGALFCFSPIVIAWLWVRSWPRLRMLEHGPRRLISSAGFVIGLSLVVVGLKVMG